jgi:hypothetical protein
MKAIYKVRDIQLLFVGKEKDDRRYISHFEVTNLSQLGYQKERGGYISFIRYPSSLLENRFNNNYYS